MTPQSALSLDGLFSEAIVEKLSEDLSPPKQDRGVTRVVIFLGFLGVATLGLVWFWDKNFDTEVAEPRETVAALQPSKRAEGDLGEASKAEAADQQIPPVPQAEAGESPTVIVQAEKALASDAKEEATPSPQPKDASEVIPIAPSNRVYLHHAIDKNPAKRGSLMRWYCGTEQEIARIQQDPAWVYRNAVGIAARRQEAGTVPLWRYTINPKRQIVGFFVGEPKRKKEKKESLLAFVWEQQGPDMIPVYLMQSSWTPMQLVVTTRRRDFLIKHADWKVHAVFYMYPLKETRGKSQ
jgi:hypothetical protein